MHTVRTFERIVNPLRLALQVQMVQCDVAEMIVACVSAECVQ